MAGGDYHPTGTPCWVEIPVLDMARAKKFYQSLFPAYKFEDVTGPDCPYQYTVYHAQGDAGEKPNVGGGLYSVASAEEIASKSGPVVFFFIRPRDVDRTLQAVTDAGGKFLTEFQEAGSGGKSRHFSDSEGNRVALYCQNPE